VYVTISSVPSFFAWRRTLLARGASGGTDHLRDLGSASNVTGRDGARRISSTLSWTTHLAYLVPGDRTQDFNQPVETPALKRED